MVTSHNSKTTKLFCSELKIYLPIHRDTRTNAKVEPANKTLKILYNDKIDHSKFKIILTFKSNFFCV